MIFLLWQLEMTGNHTISQCYYHLLLSFYRLSFPDHSYMCRILAGVGKNELIATDMVDYIDTQSLNGVACFPFFLDWILLISTSFLCLLCLFSRSQQCCVLRSCPVKAHLHPLRCSILALEGHTQPKSHWGSSFLYPLQMATLTADFQNVKECCKKDCDFNNAYDPHGDPQVWCTTCQQWFHMVCCKKQKEVKSKGDKEVMIVRGARFGVAGTGCFLDPLNPDIKKLLKTGKYPKLLCNGCRGTIWAGARLDRT